MWAIQALCRVHRVDIVTRGGWDLDELNRCSGTNVSRGDLGAVLHPPLDPQVLSRGGALWTALFKRYCRHLASRYDLCITASRTIDWGMPAIHFLSDVAWNRSLQERFHCPEALIGTSLLRRAYVGFGRALAGSSGRDPARHDVFVANSQWTARVASDYCTLQPIVIYPAVAGGAQPTPWAAREDSFICLGRISPEKQIERVIAILDQVRTLGHSVGLQLVGSGVEKKYLKDIERLCAARRDWIVFHGPLYGADKVNLLGRCRFGISACDCEAFGIATAEMMKAGILPFVPREGAQFEIVQEGELIYEDIEDAALKIDAVLRSESSRQELHLRMLRRAKAFQPEHFCTEIRELVNRALAGKPCGTA